eukprot:m.187872 g.187872  ORF g.187872 m.187872 type:complete len:182 (+) comp14784_c2_seq1:256-801(+)
MTSTMYAHHHQAQARVQQHIPMWVPVTSAAMATQSPYPYAWPTTMVMQMASPQQQQQQQQQQAPPSEPSAADMPLPANTKPLWEGYEAVIQEMQAKCSMAQKRKVGDAAKRMLSLRESLALEELDDEVLQNLTSLLMCIKNKDYTTALQWHQYVVSRSNPVMVSKFMIGIKALISVGKAMC